MLAPGDDRAVVVDGSMQVDSSDGISIKSASLKMRTDWNKNISLNEDGNEVSIQGLSFSGNTLSTHNMQGLVATSEKSIDMSVMPEESIAMTGGQFSVDVTDNVLLNARGISMETQWDKSVQFNALLSLIHI